MADRIPLRDRKSLDNDDDDFGYSAEDEAVYIGDIEAYKSKKPNVKSRRIFVWGVVILAAVSLISMFMFGFKSTRTTPKTKSPFEPILSGNKSDVNGTPSSNASNSKPKITAAEIVKYYRYPGLKTSYHWVTSSVFEDGTYIEEDGEGFNLMHIEKGLIRKLVSTKDLKHFPRGWKFTADLKYLIYGRDVESGWRHSSFAHYDLYDLETKKTQPLAKSKPDPPIPGVLGSGKQSLIVPSPEGHAVAWVRDNDLYLTLNGETEIRVTKDGSKNIINGIADWVYEEEILATNVATWFSPNGNHVAFLRTDDTLVQEYHLPYYMKFGTTSYPTQVDLKYPKPGTPNPSVQLFVFTVPQKQDNAVELVPIQLGSFSNDSAVFTEINWIDDSQFLVRVMNRVQDRQELLYVQRDDKGWKIKNVRSEKNEDDAWYNVLQPLYLVNSTKERISPSYIELMYNNEGYQHIAYFENVQLSQPSRWLTKGKWDVASIVSVDSARGIIYYSTTEFGSTERHLARVTIQGEDNKVMTPERVQPLVVPTLNEVKNRTNRGYYEAIFSPRSTYYVLGYTGPDIPWEKLYATYGNYTVDLEYDRSLEEVMATYRFPKVEYLTIPNENGDDMNAMMIFPADFDASAKDKYSVFMKAYGGPTSQQVKQGLGIDFMHKMAVSGFISVIVDGRGTGFKGRKFLTSVSKNLGLHEAEDQVAAARWLGKQPFINASRIGFWGWSYGGYLTSKIVELNSGAISVAAAVAPVTDWRYYDTMYSERYMKTPQDNPIGYASSAVTKMDGFRNVRFFLAHGTGDDNVHFQNSAHLVWHLTRAGVRSYQVRYFTDSEHSLSVNDASSQLYYFLEKFICKELYVDCEKIGSSK